MAYILCLSLLKQVHYMRKFNLNLTFVLRRSGEAFPWFPGNWVKKKSVLKFTLVYSTFEEKQNSESVDNCILYFIYELFFKGTSNNDNPLYITMQIKPGTANGLAQRYHIMACNETRKSVCSQLPSVCVHTCQSARESSIPFVSHNESTIAMTVNGLQSP